MKKKSAAQPTDQQAGTAKLPFDAYTIETMHRSALVDAPYNPRIMSDDAKKRLRSGLKRHPIR
jgi:hypothetical protein